MRPSPRGCVLTTTPPMRMATMPVSAPKAVSPEAFDDLMN